MRSVLNAVQSNMSGAALHTHITLTLSADALQLDMAPLAAVVCTSWSSCCTLEYATLAWLGRNKTSG